MHIDDRKKINANDIYLVECVAITFSKVRAEGYNFFDKNGKLQNNNIICVENYANQTVTCAFNPNAMNVHLDGTDFSATFSSNDKGGFVYKVKPLGLEYVCNERLLENEIYEKKVLRTSGNSANYFRYLTCGTFFLLLESYTKTGDEIIKIKKSEVEKYNDEQLVQYAQEQMAKSEELDYDDDDDDYEDVSEEELESIAEMYENNPTDEEEYNESFDELKQVDKVLECEDDNIYDVKFDVSNYIKEELNYGKYECDLPERVEDFDYQEYMNSLRESEGKAIYTCSSNHHDILNVEDDDPDNEIDDDEQDYDEDEYDEDENGIAETVITEEGFIDESDYEVTKNNKPVEEEAELQNAVDLSIVDIMDVDQEVMNLVKYYNDLYCQIAGIRDIIIRRKEAQDKKRESSKCEKDR